MTLSGSLALTQISLLSLSGVVDSLSGRISSLENTSLSLSGTVFSLSGRFLSLENEVQTLSGNLNITNSNLLSLSGVVATKISLTALSATGGISYNNITGEFGDLFSFNSGLSRVGNTI